MGMEKIGDRAEWWCLYGDLGYDQYQRWDIRVGGECDCSSLALHCVYEAGYAPQPFTWGNTDSMPQQLKALGFKQVAAGTNPPRGVIRLRNGHTAISLGGGKIAQASIDENGRITGGKSGDQTGRETNVSNDPNNWLWDFYAPDAPTTQTTTQTSASSGTTVLRRGSKGDTVKKLQSALIAAGYSCGSWGVDGSYGAATEAAVRKYQTDHGLEVDGIAGAQTQGSLYGGSAGAQPAQSASAAYSAGRYQTCVGELNVRTGAGTNYARKSKSQLTADGQRHSNGQGQLDSGTVVDVSETAKDGSGNWWGRIPSGWICLNYQGKAYAVRK